MGQCGSARSLTKGACHATVGNIGGGGSLDVADDGVKVAQSRKPTLAMMQHKTNTNKSLRGAMKNAAIVLIMLCVTGCARSDAETVLVPGQPVSAALESNGQADYATDLEANNFVYGEVDQIDFDVKITVLDPTL
jgi:hypothetical protein